MKKIIVLFFCLLSLPFSAQAQLLYRISGQGLTEPSYLLGTYHLASSSFTDTIPGFHAAMDASRQVCGELVMSEVASPENMAKMQQAMMLPEGQTLMQLLSADELKALDSFVEEMMGVKLTNPMVASSLGKMTPSALVTQLSLLMYLKKSPNFNVNDGIDTYVQTFGASKGKAVKGLESVDDQIHALFKSQTLERQKQLLVCMVKHKDYQMQLTCDLVDAYHAQDLDRIEKITDDKLNDECDSSEEELNVLIYDRNRNWMTKMPDLMKQAPTFFAVGAAHLVGEQGLLNLLKNAGYKVEGMK